MNNYSRIAGSVFVIAVVCLISALTAIAENNFDTDVIKTSAGDLKVTFIGHGTLLIEFSGKVIHIDPFARLADYAKLPKADVIIITHHHEDHLDLEAVKKIRTSETKVVLTEKCAEEVKGGIIMKNGDVTTVEEIKIEAVPAYNLVHKRDNGQVFHSKGEGNGYVLTFGDKKVYIAGDTENTPEMKVLKNIGIAFLPMNLPYTMTPEMVADAVEAFKPKILYPYHYGETDTSKLLDLIADNEDVEVRIRNMK